MRLSRFVNTSNCLLSLVLFGVCTSSAFAYEVGDVVMTDVYGGMKLYESGKITVKEPRGYSVLLLPGNKHKGEYFVPEKWISGMAPSQAVSPEPVANTPVRSLPARSQANSQQIGSLPAPQIFAQRSTTSSVSKSPVVSAGPAAPVAGSKGLNGLYLRHEQTFQGTALSYREDHYFFFPDGRVYHGVPPEGPSAFDWSKAQREDAAKCGQYAINGGKITFSYSGNKPYTWPLKMTAANEMELNMSPTVKVEKFGANAKLNGSFHRGTTFGGNYSYGSAPTIVKSGVYNFSLNGTVTNDSMKGIGGDTKDTGVTASIYQGNKGTYSINGNDMTLSLGGQTMRCTIYPITDSGTLQQPVRISINGALFERKK